MYTYVTRMLHVCIRVLLVCIRMLPCVTRMYSYVPVCIPYVKYPCGVLVNPRYLALSHLKACRHVAKK